MLPDGPVKTLGFYMTWPVLPSLAEEVKERGPDDFWTRTGPVMRAMGRKQVRWGVGKKRRPVKLGNVSAGCLSKFSGSSVLSRDVPKGEWMKVIP